jgi:dephospho-CoA kinase
MGKDGLDGGMMKRVLLTGMSGTGKSTVIEELAIRGYRAVDADDARYSHMVNVRAGELTGIGSGLDWMWREDRIQDLLATENATGVLFVSGCSSNQGKFYDRFDHIILLTAPAGVMAERLATRTNNPFGQDPEEVARSLQLKDEIEPLLRRGADLEIDTSLPLDDVVTEVLRHIGVSGTSS